MATLHGHAAGNGGHGQGEPTGTAPVLDPTFRGGDGNVGIIRSPVRAIALPDCVPQGGGPARTRSTTAAPSTAGTSTAAPSIPRTRSSKARCREASGTRSGERASGATEPSGSMPKPDQGRPMNRMASMQVTAAITTASSARAAAPTRTAVALGRPTTSLV